MRTEQLEYFLEIVKTGSMNIASSNLHISHQSLNRSMRSLEEDLGCPLFIRTARGTTLTPSGEKLAKAAESVLHILADLRQDLLSPLVSPSTLKGTLRVNITPIASALLFNIFPTAYANKYPFVLLAIQELNPDEAVQSVCQKQCDLALTTMSQRNLDELDCEHVGYHILLEDTTQVIMNKHAPLAQNRSISLKMLLKQPLVFFSVSANTESHWLLDILSQYGAVKRSLITNSSKFFVDAITNSGYISPFSRRHFESLPPNVRQDLVMIPFRTAQEREMFTFYVTLLVNKTISATPATWASWNTQTAWARSATPNAAIL